VWSIQGGSARTRDRVTPNGRSKPFPLAVHQGEETRWHKIVFFGDKVEKVMNEIKRGSS